MKYYISKSSGTMYLVKEYITRASNNDTFVKLENIVTGNTITITETEFLNSCYEASKIESTDIEKFYNKQ